MAYFQGKFKPKNPKKYTGDPDNIQYRSGWEFKYMMQLDHDPNVVQWASEEMSVPYISPIDRKPHRYFPDFIVKKRDGKVYMIEIKPNVQTKRPKLIDKPRRKQLKEAATYAINLSKWEAAREYCKKNGMEFVILTERELNLK